ncbi:hypothetical protein Srot_1845 [Segniliparus rotundus DSM 44985]|uniref:Uncharacterized protein n=1 Tax=Segniliparus rotundus (strain ATCC BAA-972 / CDC 1076 / CIP 108378 / DSM 44985 / JCM 13578) TaxID=640132 RepID=D6Z8M5_SEGRD|nr:hypothetical protein [Segniliparus rotundus]ADG98305.1 hypothetical protein Srot_1845 [Segniliparus rotundus DSM 44985]
MPDIQFGGEGFQVDIEPNPWQSELAPEHAALVGKPLPELRLPSTETTDVLLPLHQLGRSRIMIITLPQVATEKHPLPEHLADNPLAQGGTLVHQGLHDNYENLASIGFYYTFVVTTQSVEELREIIRPEPRQQFPGLSDPDLKLADLLNLPTFTVEGKRYYEPFAMILWDSLVERVVYPITDCAGYARWAFNWARLRRPDLDFLNYNLDRGAYTRRNR